MAGFGARWWSGAKMLAKMGGVPFKSPILNRMSNLFQATLSIPCFFCSQLPKNRGTRASAANVNIVVTFVISFRRYCVVSPPFTCFSAHRSIWKCMQIKLFMINEISKQRHWKKCSQLDSADEKNIMNALLRFASHQIQVTDKQFDSVIPVCQYHSHRSNAISRNSTGAPSQLSRRY